MEEIIQFFENDSIKFLQTLIILYELLGKKTTDFQEKLIQSIIEYQNLDYKISNELALKFIENFSKLFYKFENLFLKTSSNQQKEQIDENKDNAYESYNNTKSIKFDADPKFIKKFDQFENSLFNQSIKEDIFIDHVSKKQIEFEVKLSDIENDMIDTIKSRKNRFFKQFWFDYQIQPLQIIVRMKSNIKSVEKDLNNYRGNQEASKWSHCFICIGKAELSNTKNNSRTTHSDVEALNNQNINIRIYEKINFQIYWKSVQIYCLKKCFYDKSQLKTIFTLLQKIKEIESNQTYCDLFRSIYYFDKNFKDEIDSFLLKRFGTKQ